MEQNFFNEELNKDILYLDVIYQYDEKLKELDDDEFKGYILSDDLLYCVV